MKCWFHPEARLELLESVSYYEDQQMGLGQRFLDSVSDAVRRIGVHPEMYRLISGSWRQCRLIRFPFGLIYRVTNQGIEIIALMHLYRKPDYWKDRPTESDNL